LGGNNTGTDNKPELKKEQILSIVHNVLIIFGRSSKISKKKLPYFSIDKARVIYTKKV